MESVYDVIILFSGGVESVALSQLAKQMNLSAFYILLDYNQLHKEELNFGIKYLEDLEKEKCWTKVKVDLNVDSALTGSGEKGLYGGCSPYHVPMRNTIFLSIACSYAESMGIPKVWIGASYDDAINNFVDCVQKYILEFNELLKVASPSITTVEAPFLGFRKEMVIKLLESYGVSTEVAFSGYGQFT